MYPIEHYDTLRRGREELLQRAEYERLVRKAMFRQRMNWLGMRLVSWGAKLEKFGAFVKRQPTSSTTTRLRVRPLSKMSPHH